MTGNFINSVLLSASRKTLKSRVLTKKFRDRNMIFYEFSFKDKKE